MNQATPIIHAYNEIVDKIVELDLPATIDMKPILDVRGDRLAFGHADDDRRERRSVLCWVPQLEDHG